MKQWEAKRAALLADKRDLTRFLGAELRRLDFVSPGRACAIGVVGGVISAGVLTVSALGPARLIGFLVLLSAATLLALSARSITVLDRRLVNESSADALDLVEIAGGRFLMGSPETEEGRGKDEGPVHEVEVSAFLCMRYPVTCRLYSRIMGLAGWPPKGSEDLPVTHVSWFDAVEFCNRLSKKEKRTACYRIEGERVHWNRAADGYRLLTEAEWEYACRAGTSTPWSCGDDLNRLVHYAWFDANSNRTPHPVGRKLPNAWSLHDMHGNVWEWCWDGYGNYWTDLQRNPVGPREGEFRVLRGGAFIHSLRVLRSAERFSAPATLRFPDFGFRCARNLHASLGVTLSDVAYLGPSSSRNTLTLRKSALLT